MTIEHRVVVRAPYSIVFVGSPAGPVPAELAATVHAGMSSVVIGTLQEDDGETTVTVTDAAVSARADQWSAFEGDLLLPDGQLSVFDCYMDRYLTLEHGPFARVRVWINHATEPDDIVVELLSDAPKSVA